MLVGAWPRSVDSALHGQDEAIHRWMVTQQWGSPEARRASTLLGRSNDNALSTRSSSKKSLHIPSFLGRRQQGTRCLRRGDTSTNILPPRQPGDGEQLRVYEGGISTYPHHVMSSPPHKLTRKRPWLGISGKALRWPIIGHCMSQEGSIQRPGGWA